MQERSGWQLESPASAASLPPDPGLVAPADLAQPPAASRAHSSAALCVRRRNGEGDHWGGAAARTCFRLVMYSPKRLRCNIMETKKKRSQEGPLKCLQGLAGRGSARVLCGDATFFCVGQIRCLS